MVRPFYCELCNKQYKIATEYEAHLSSYDHGHKKVGRTGKDGEDGQDGEDGESGEGRGCLGR